MGRKKLYPRMQAKLQFLKKNGLLFLDKFEFFILSLPSKKMQYFLYDLYNRLSFLVFRIFKKKYVKFGNYVENRAAIQKMVTLVR